MAHSLAPSPAPASAPPAARRPRRAQWLALCLAAVLVAVALSVCIGGRPSTLAEAWHALVTPSGTVMDVTIRELRWPRTVTAVYTFWLAARAHGIGAGWVSILDPTAFKAALDVPESWKLVAYLCVGYPVEQHADPELERYGWEAGGGEATTLLRR